MSLEAYKANRSLRALFILGFALGVVASIGGGIILALDYSHEPHVAQPLWQFGQYIMFQGILNVAILVGIVFQVRKLSGHNSHELPR